MSDRDPFPSLGLAPAPLPPVAPGSSSSAGGLKTWQDGETTSFRDVLAILNPLQHIPIVGTVYRAVTGDQISLMPSIIGGTLFGGPVGLAFSLANGALRSATGRDAGDTVLAGLFGSSVPAAPDEPQMASAAAPPAPVPAPAPKLAIDIPAPRAGTEPAASGPPPVKAGMPLAFQSPLAARFRSTELPSPVAEGGGQVRSGDDLVPTPAGTAITRDAVPVAMASALDKYAAMMRARTQTPTQVSVLR